MGKNVKQVRSELSAATANIDNRVIEVQPHGGALARGSLPGGQPGGGRPDSYDPSCCAIVEELGRVGAGLAEMAVACGMSKRDTLHDWAKSHPDFAVSFTRARLYSLAWWESQGRIGVMAGKDFNDRQWSRMVAVMFPDTWTDVQRVELRGLLGRVDMASAPPSVVSRIASGEPMLAALVAAATELAQGPQEPDWEIVTEPQDPPSEG